MLTPEEKITVESYQNQAALWASRHNTVGFWQAEMDAFKKLLPSGRVVEIGCGGGRDARELLACGYRYYGCDMVREFLPVARAQNPHGHFFQASLYELPLPLGSFDGLWAAAVLLHLPKSRVRSVLQEMAAVLRPGGIAFIAIKEGAGETITVETDDDVTLRRFFALYRVEEFGELLKANNFVIEYVAFKPRGSRMWLCYIVRKPIRP